MRNIRLTTLPAASLPITSPPTIQPIPRQVAARRPSPNPTGPPIPLLVAALLANTDSTIQATPPHSLPTPTHHADPYRANTPLGLYLPTPTGLAAPTLVQPSLPDTDLPCQAPPRQPCPSLPQRRLPSPCRALSSRAFPHPTPTSQRSPHLAYPCQPRLTVPGHCKCKKRSRTDWIMMNTPPHSTPRGRIATAPRPHFLRRLYE